MSPGDVLTIKIDKPSYEKYVFSVMSIRELSASGQPEELQKTLLEATNAEEAVFEVTLSEDITYRGHATIFIYGVVKENPEELANIMYGDWPFKII